MSDTPSENPTLPQVAYVHDGYRLVINRGSAAGIRKGQRFLIVGLGAAITDPVTDKPLGRLEIVRGTGIITHVQELIATLETDMKFPGKKITREVTPRRTATESYMALLSPSYPKSETITEAEPPSTTPFDQAAVGDHARPV